MAFFYVHINFVKVQFEAKVLEICTNLVQCCVVVIFIQLDYTKDGMATIIYIIHPQVHSVPFHLSYIII